MRGNPEPWYRASNQRWYVQLGGRQIPLARGPKDASRDAAYVAYHSLMASRGKLQVSPTVAYKDLAELFLDAIESGKASTYDWYQRFLESFTDCYSGTVADLKPAHVNAWLAGKPTWGASTRRGGIVAVKRVIQWANKAGHIDIDPLKQLVRPAVGRREVIASGAEFDAILAATDEPFGNFVKALRYTGARPGEVRIVEARHFNAKAATWTFAPAECIKRSDRQRVIYLPPNIVELCEKLAKANPKGPLFLNARGRPWKRFAIRDRLKRLIAAGVIPPGVAAYSFRHGFATDALSNGVYVTDLQELLGHKDLTMITQHYNHTGQRGQQLREAARRATG